MLSGILKSPWSISCFNCCCLPMPIKVDKCSSLPKMKIIILSNIVWPHHGQSINEIPCRIPRTRRRRGVSKNVLVVGFS